MKRGGACAAKAYGAHGEQKEGEAGTSEHSKQAPDSSYSFFLEHRPDLMVVCVRSGHLMEEDRWKVCLLKLKNMECCGEDREGKLREAYECFDRKLDERVAVSFPAPMAFRQNVILALFQLIRIFDVLISTEYKNRRLRRLTCCRPVLPSQN